MSTALEELAASFLMIALCISLVAMFLWILSLLPSWDQTKRSGKVILLPVAFLLLLATATVIVKAGKELLHFKEARNLIQQKFDLTYPPAVEQQDSTP